MAAKQSAADRLKRLDEGRCPIHGLDMTQVGLANDGRLFIVACPRKDCSVQATEARPFGEATLLPAFSHLIEIDESRLTHEEQRAERIALAANVRARFPKPTS
ncbi:hypothetical protein [Paraburkholderia sp. RL17-337-BIB-A]|uniref:hypothetical protein n=1 Tax=Paraburkholderia sp. RL17-337-BIB-A TaxID=3031636 RepID=UPI0038BC9C37